MIEDLKGKSVLITGSSTGIGAAVAKAFGANGARVAVHYNSSESEARAVADVIAKSGSRNFEKCDAKLSSNEVLYCFVDCKRLNIFRIF